MIPAMWRVGDATSMWMSIRVLPMWCLPLGGPVSEGLSCPERTCWYISPYTPVSAALARRSWCSLAGQRERGLFSISWVRRRPCAPPTHRSVSLLFEFLALCPSRHPSWRAHTFALFVCWVSIAVP